MGKDQQKELRRLEAALMEEDDWESYRSHQQDRPTQTWAALDTSDYSAENTDRVDVDMQSYSEEVYQDPSIGGKGVLITMGLMVLLSVSILILFKILGVL